MTSCVRERMTEPMESDDIERFEEERELELYREYRDVLPMFTYVIETERRFYLANKVDIAHLDGGWVQVDLADAWVWDMFRPARFVASVRVDDPAGRERRGARAPRRADHDPRLTCSGSASLTSERGVGAAARTSRPT